MISAKRFQALARVSVAVLMGMTLGACGVSSFPAPAAQTPDSAARPSGVADTGSVVPEIVVTATRLPGPRVAEETSSRPPVKRRS